MADNFLGTLIWNPIVLLQMTAFDLKASLHLVESQRSEQAEQTYSNLYHSNFRQNMLDYHFQQLNYATYVFLIEIDQLLVKVAAQDLQKRISVHVDC